jgi:hypothetical protein
MDHACRIRAISARAMDGKGACRDNVFVERLWRSVKYEEAYLWAYESVSDARTSIGRYLDGHKNLQTTINFYECRARDR